VEQVVVERYAHSGDEQHAQKEQAVGGVALDGVLDHLVQLVMQLGPVLRPFGHQVAVVKRRGRAAHQGKVVEGQENTIDDLFRQHDELLLRFGIYLIVPRQK
jgi:hypothetical protein